MDAQIENYRKKIKFETDKINKLKLEIKFFKERKDEEILNAQKKITIYEQSILNLTA